MSNQNSEGSLYALSTEGLEKLRTLKGSDAQKIWGGSLDKLVGEDSGDLSETRFQADSFPKLRLPEGRENFDKENAAVLYSALSDLTPVEAADERLWVTLALGEYREYLSARWPKSAKVEFSAHLDNHVFATTSRNRFRDQAIARLWWIARFIDRNFSDETEKAYAVFFTLDSDVLSSYLGRPNLVAVPGVARAVVEVAHKAFISQEKTAPYDRDKFRDFLKDLDLENGRQLVSHKNSELIRSQVEETFKKQFPDFK
jgi:hypothetical protein